MLLVHSHVGCLQALTQSRVKTEFGLFFEFRLRVLSHFENSDEHATTPLGNPKEKGF